MNMDDKIGDKLSDQLVDNRDDGEPALRQTVYVIAGVIVASIAGGLGLDLTSNQQWLLTAAVGVAASAGTGWLIRAKVFSPKTAHALLYWLADKYRRQTD